VEEVDIVGRTIGMALPSLSFRAGIGV